MSRRLLLAIAVGVVALLALGSLATASSSKSRTGKDTFVQFRMPSNNVFCAYVVASSPYAKYVRCDIMSGIKPKPTGGRCIEGVRGISADIDVTGRATFPCSSDTVYNKSAPLLQYGKTWRRGGFTCKSSMAGLRCSNLSQHGFFLSRAHSYRF
ncbi:MAG TPA: DUF6636 domain-containing protein [Gaiellaceae bacterium]